uniref:Uncharacterized protein n=1 Tax=Glossina pallidipes TaxID=7398 RepID=A0A1A9ZV03_GLOPL
MSCKFAFVFRLEEEIDLTYRKNNQPEIKPSSALRGGFSIMSKSGGLKPRAVAGRPSMARPSSTAATMEEKLSSANTISAADLATAVPEPIAIPISAFFKAGASFTPSPVIAEISFMLCKYSTILDLCWGSTRENKRALAQAAFCSEGGKSSNSRPE